MRRVCLSTVLAERSGSGHSAIRRISSAAVLIALGTHQLRAAQSRQSAAIRLLEAIGQRAANTQLADPESKRVFLKKRTGTVFSVCVGA